VTFKNFSGDKDQEEWVKSLLVDGEELLAIIGTARRFISVTSQRLILDEMDGNFSVIRNSTIGAVEVSMGRGSAVAINVQFGGGLSQQLSAPNKEQAEVIASAAARG
jgi:hypothetical protein